jgi:hypothetical protein
VISKPSTAKKKEERKIIRRWRQKIPLFLEGTIIYLENQEEKLYYKEKITEPDSWLTITLIVTVSMCQALE